MAGRTAQVKRGDLVLVREPNTPAAKPRPCVIIQHDSALHDAVKVTVCPLTTSLRDTARLRPLIPPTAQNGLRAPSEIEIDWLYTYRLSSIGPRIGQLDDASMRHVDDSLRDWLGL